MGIVKDPSGAVIPGANVSLINMGTGATRTTTTDNQGGYSFPALAVGQYDLEVSATGFLPERRTGVGRRREQRATGGHEPHTCWPVADSDRKRRGGDGSCGKGRHGVGTDY